MHYVIEYNLKQKGKHHYMNDFIYKNIINISRKITINNNKNKKKKHL